MKPRICFVAPTAYPVISRNRAIEIVGGAELQQSTLAKALAANGYEVSMICMDHGQREAEQIDGVTILRCYAPGAGVPVLRFFSPRITSLWKAMGRSNADIYVQRAAGMLTGLVAYFAKTNGKACVFSAANDPDFIRPTPKIQNFRDRKLFEYGVRHADEIIVQNRYQHDLCLKNYHRESVLIRNCLPLPTECNGRPDGYVLWVATIRETKRPHLFLDIAEQLPDVNFVMIGGASKNQQDLYEDISNRSALLPNVNFLGFVPFADITQYFDGARLFVNTSKQEGFPNTILQSWSRSIPTISFLDFHAYVGSRSVTELTATTNEMTQKIHSLMNDDDKWRAAGRIAREYFLQNHSVEASMQEYEKLFSSLTAFGKYKH